MLFCGNVESDGVDVCVCLAADAFKARVECLLVGCMTALDLGEHVSGTNVATTCTEFRHYSTSSLVTIMPHFADGSVTNSGGIVERTKPGDVAQQADERKILTLVKNRRLRYLERHPEYFEEPDLELAGRLILLFHTLTIRQHPTRSATL